MLYMYVPHIALNSILMKFESFWEPLWLIDFGFSVLLYLAFESSLLSFLLICSTQVQVLMCVVAKSGICMVKIPFFRYWVTAKLKTIINLKGFCILCCVIILVRVVLKITFVSDWPEVMFRVRWMTLKMTSSQVVKTSATNNSFFQNYPHLDDHAIWTTDTPGFKLFT